MPRWDFPSVDEWPAPYAERCGDGLRVIVLQWLVFQRLFNPSPDRQPQFEQLPDHFYLAEKFTQRRNARLETYVLIIVLLHRN